MATQLSNPVPRLPDTGHPSIARRSSSLLELSHRPICGLRSWDPAFVLDAETLQRLGKTVETEKFSQLQWCSEFDDQKYKAILGLKESGISPSESAV